MTRTMLLSGFAAIALLARVSAAQEEDPGSGTPAPAATTPAPEATAAPAETPEPSATGTPAPAATASPAAAPTAAPAANTPLEDIRTQSPIAPEPARMTMSGFGSGVTHGNGSRVEPLLGEVEHGGWGAAWRGVSGITETSIELRSTATGRLRTRTRLGAADTISVTARRDRALSDPRGRIPLPADLEFAAPALERWHDRAAIEWRHLFAQGFLQETALDAGYDGEGGSRGSLSGGRDATSSFSTNQFDTPSTRSFDRRTVVAGARASAAAAGIRLGASARWRSDRLTNRFDAIEQAAGTGSLSVGSDTYRQSLEGALGGDSSPLPTLHVGGSLRSAWRRSDPRTSRTIAEPNAPVQTFQSEDIDITDVRHRAALGASWLPHPGVRTSIRLDGESARITAHQVEDRALATYEISDGHSTWTPWRAGAHADASWRTLPMLELAARFDGRLGGGDDSTDRSMLLADRVTVTSLYLRDLTHREQSARGEFTATVRPWSRTRLYAGEQLRRELLHTSGSPLAIRDRDATRAQTFAGARTAWRRSTLDARVSAFRENSRVDGEKPLRDGWDARVRGATSAGPASLWASGAWTDDELALGVDPTLAPATFRSRALVAAGGATIALKGGFAGLSASEARASGDPRSRLTSVSGEAGMPLGKKWSASAGVRWLEMKDDRAPWTNGTGIAGILRLSASY